MELVIQLYAKGMTTSDMTYIIKELYGYHYSPATVANITKLTEQSVLAFHERQLKKKPIFQNEAALDCFLVTQFDQQTSELKDDE